MKKTLDSIETVLTGKWISQNGTVVADDVSKRIEYLIQSVLTETSSSDDGWDILYVDPSDGRFWELVHSESDSHGGGAPTLNNLSSLDAKKKYRI